MASLKLIADTIYRTKVIRKKFDLKYPQENVVAADFARGRLKTEKFKSELGRINSQRAVILLTDKGIKCGTWEIPIESITNCKLLKINIFGPAYILKIETKNHDHYEFGMQRNIEWLEQKVIPLIEENAGLEYRIIGLVGWVILAFHLIRLIVNFMLV